MDTYVANRSMHTYVADTALKCPRHGPWSLGLSPKLPRARSRPDLGPVPCLGRQPWAWAHAPGAGPGLHERTVSYIFVYVYA